MAATRALRRLQELRLRGEPVRDRVPVLRHPAAQAGAEARARRRRGPRARGPHATGAGARPPSGAAASPTGAAAARTWRCGPWPRSRRSRSRRSLLIVERASNLSVFDLGAIVGPVGDEWWRYLAAPFVYDDLGYLFACGLAIAIFLPRARAPGRHGRRRCCWCSAAARSGCSPPTASTPRFGDGIPVAAGGNGIALGVALRLARDPRRRAPRRPDRGVRPDRGRGGGVGAPAAARWSRTSPRSGPGSPAAWSAPPAGWRRARRRAPSGASRLSKFTPLTDELHDYMVAHGARQDEVLRRVQEETAAMGDIAVMQIAPDQGAFMTLLARLIGAREAIELGTFTGYSAICIARGLAPGRAADRLRALRGVRRDRGAQPRGRRRRRPDRDPDRPGARDAARAARARGLRPRLHRRRQGRATPPTTSWSWRAPGPAG